ncbi:MAG TPA: enoyl-CoA hydratase-related protein [Acidimicrobiales bacterium]|nr:enoyl-CoA hydratase-related protein [Acidimicrobiales bacterium]
MSGSGPTTLDLERRGAVLQIALDRPEARNAIDSLMRDELTELFLSSDADPAVRAIVVTGKGADFCTGADLMPAGSPDAARTPPTLAIDYRRHFPAWHRLFQTYWELETPVVSAVNGTTAGVGWMLALLADLVVAGEGARWTHAFARRGMVPHAGDPFFLPRVLPFHRLNEIALLSEPVTSEVLAGWGVVNRLVAVAEVLATAGELADRLAAGPTRSLGLAKRLYRRSLVSDMATAFAEEVTATALVSQTHDRKEGVSSMMERRPPDFTGT